MERDRKLGELSTKRDWENKARKCVVATTYRTVHNRKTEKNSANKRQLEH